MKLWPWLFGRGETRSTRPPEDDDAPASRTPVVMIKIGGSLLDLPDLGARLWKVRTSRPDDVAAFLAGGGRTTDAVRDYQKIQRFSDDSAHWAAMHALAINTILLRETFERFLPVEKIPPYMGPRHTFERLHPPGVVLADPLGFLTDRDAGERFRSLPATWDLTSDSIAAVMASELRAAELILLKSRPAPNLATRAEAVRDGGVDPLFATYAAPIERVTWINLRDDPTRETELVK